MYLSHFNLSKKPFDISPDPDFLWLGEKHREGLATLKYGILQNKGFLMITGDVGTGKTALIRAIENQVQAHLIVITIPDPSLTLMDFYNVMAAELGIDRSFNSKGAFLIEFKKLILKAASTHKRVLMIIDEAHRLTGELLEEVRLLSNIDLGGQVLINTFFVGQLEFKDLIARPENRPVRQRITVSYELNPLSPEETTNYIEHRLKVSGARRPVFAPEAVRAVHSYSRGYPRLTNIICDHALMSAFSSGLDSVSLEMIRECAQDLRITLGAVTPERGKPIDRTLSSQVKTSPLPQPANVSNRRVWRQAAIAAIIIAATSLGWHYGWDRISGDLSRLFSATGLHPTTEKRDPLPAPLYAGPNESQAPAGAAVPKGEHAAEVKASALASVPKPLPPVAASAPNGQSGAAALEAQPQAASPPLQAREAAASSDTQAARKSVEDGASVQKPFELKEFTLYFTKNSTDIPIYAQELLAVAAALLRASPATQAIIEGHTDSSGDHAMNRAISEGRANSVRQFFLDKGIAVNRLAVAALADEKPIVSNSTPEGRSKNRRVVIRLVAVGP